MLVSWGGGYGPRTVKQVEALFRWASSQPKEAWKPLPAPARHVLARTDNYDALKASGSTDIADEGVALVWGPVADIIRCNGVGFDAWMDIPD